MNSLGYAMEIMIPIIAIISTFTFIGVLAWTKHRRSERQAYYRHELVKQMAEKADSENQLLAFMREEAKSVQIQRRQGLMVAGLITLAVGIGYMIAFQWIDDEIWMIGAIPALIGVAMFAGAFLYGENKS